MDVVNRYASQDLHVEKQHHTRYNDFVGGSEKDGRPFARQVDIWWVAIGIGVQIGHRTPLGAETTKFNDGAILGTDPWRITHLELLALAEGDAAVLESPSEVIKIATEYANTGFPWLIDQMLGKAEPALSLMMKLGALDEISALGL